MPYYPELKVVGWTSSYKSVQKFLDSLKKDRLSDEEATACLDSIFMLCKSTAKNPDEIVALGKSHWYETTGALKAYLDGLNVTKDEMNFRLACVIDFLALNKAF
jgi:hypothetical protein